MAGETGAFSGRSAAAALPHVELVELAERRPELAPWLRPLGVALAAVDAPPWAGLSVRPDPARDAAVPLLHGAAVPLEGSAALPLLWEVLGAALEEDGRLLAMAVDPLELLAAAVARDDAAIAALAQRGGAEPAAAAAAAQLAALPLLHAARAALEPGVPASWSERYCPVCGAPPALVEVRGLERRRTLRCGRCGGAWATEVLLCAFCGERDHDRLGSLVPDGTEGQLRWIESCASCGGYLKAFTTLRGTASAGVALLDAASVELDLVAGERGLARPAEAGFSVHLRFVSADAGDPGQARSDGTLDGSAR